MTELISNQYTELSADSVTALSQKETVELLQQLDPQWQLNIDAPTINLKLNFSNYYQTMAFVNVIAQIAHQQDHHPNLLISYNSCTVSNRTHSVGGLSIKDFICAVKINAAQSL